MNHQLAVRHDEQWKSKYSNFYCFLLCQFKHKPNLYMEYKRGGADFKLKGAYFS